MKPLVLIFILFAVWPAWAGDSTQSLPKGIFGVRLNTIYVTGVDYGYGPDGQKETVGTLHESSISQQAQSTIFSANGSSVGGYVFSSIIQALQNSPSGTFGIDVAQAALAKLDLGTIKENVLPSVTAVVPTLLYGVTNWFSLIVAAPYIREKYDVNMEYQRGANSDLLDTASQLANAAGITSVPSSSQLTSYAQGILAQKGYKPLESKERSIFADVHVGGLFSLGKVGNLSFGAMSMFTLPTGPAHDPDELLDSSAYHHTAFSQEVTAVYTFSKKLDYYLSGGAQYNLPEKSTFRVPKDDQDLDPDPSQKEEVNWQVGLGTFAETGFKYRMFERLVVEIGAVYASKVSDTFSGSSGLDYQALSGQTPYLGNTAYSYKVALTYDPLSTYRPGSIPLMFDMAYQDTFSGTNAAAIRELVFALSTFF